MDPLVQIIVLNWNGADDTLRCVASLEQQTYPRFQIAVVDNGSTDDSWQALSGLGDHIHLVRLDQNLGYTGGNNAAMADAFAAGADYVWLFNNDAEADPDSLRRLIARCEADSSIGLASPLVLEASDRTSVQLGCGLFDLTTPSFVPTYDIAQAREWHEKYPDRIVLHGTALLIRRALYDRIGGLDDLFFAYWEDIDYSIRSAQAGFRNVAVLETAIYHGSKQTREAPESIKPHYYYFYSRNELLMWRKFATGRKFLRAALWILQRQMRQIARMPANTAGIDAVLSGLWHGWRNIGGSYNPTRKMPRLLRQALARNPGLWLRLMNPRT